MKIVHEQTLFDCLEQFEAGVPVEELVAKYPHAAAEIEKFLAVAAQLSQIRLQPSLAARQKSQKDFLNKAAQLKAAHRHTWLDWQNLQRRLLPLVSLAMVTLLLGATFLFASGTALPGDILYSTKRLVESFQLEQAVDPTAVFALQFQQNQERLREVKVILRTSETADLNFEGRLNTRQGSNWVIAGIAVHIGEQTQIVGPAERGAWVLVNGRAQNGHFYASRITVLQAVPPTATASPSPASTATTTAAPTTTSTFTAIPSATTASTATQTVPASPTGMVPASPTSTVSTTPIPGATASATPTETAVPTEPGPPATAVPPTATSEPTSVPTAVGDNDNDNGGDDNQNDNGDDNGNDNGDDNRNDNAGDNGNENDNGNDNSGDNENENEGDDDDNSNDDNENDNGGSSGSGGGSDNENDNGDNGNENGRNEDE